MGMSVQATLQLDPFAADPPHSAVYLPLKRGLDIALSAVLLGCLAPVMGICALAIRLESPGPLLFRQERVGERGKRFRLLKFRSMVANADATPHREYVAAFIRGTAARQGGEGGAVYKLAHDPRV